MNFKQKPLSKQEKIKLKIAVDNIIDHITRLYGGEKTVDVDYQEVKDEPVYGPPAFLKFLPPPNNVE